MLYPASDGMYLPINMLNIKDVRLRLQTYLRGINVSAKPWLLPLCNAVTSAIINLQFCGWVIETALLVLILAYMAKIVFFIIYVNTY